jgi:hypothetical protein
MATHQPLVIPPKGMTPTKATTEVMADSLLIMVNAGRNLRLCGILVM